MVEEVLEDFDTAGGEMVFVSTGANDEVDTVILGFGASEDVFFEGSEYSVDIIIEELNV